MFSQCRVLSYPVLFVVLLCLAISHPALAEPRIEKGRENDFNFVYGLDLQLPMPGREFLKICDEKGIRVEPIGEGQSMDLMTPPLPPTREKHPHMKWDTYKRGYKLRDKEQEIVFGENEASQLVLTFLAFVDENAMVVFIEGRSAYRMWHNIE